MKTQLNIAVLFGVFLTVVGNQIFWNPLNFKPIDLNKIAAGSAVDLIPKKLFIFPGTKWCGAGDTADNDNDYGTERDTDKCCQNHDYCPDVIEGHQTKYNLTNPSFYTRLHCDCDGEFYKCLKSVNTKASNQVGQIYFTALGTQCYNKFYPIAGCHRFSFFPKRKCLEYTFDESKRMKYQWFDLPNY